MRYRLGMVAKPCGVASVYLIGSGLLWDRLCRKKDEPNITRILTPQDRSTSVIAQIRLFILMFLALLMPLLAYAFKGIGETLTRSIFGSGAVIAFGKRVFLFLAIRSFARDMLTDTLLQLLEKFVLIPVGALYALGLLGMVAARQPRLPFSARHF